MILMALWLGIYPNTFLSDIDPAVQKTVIAAAPSDQLAATPTIADDGRRAQAPSARRRRPAAGAGPMPPLPPPQPAAAAAGRLRES